MSNGILVGGVLVTGFVVFMTGAVAWRPEYDRPLAESLPVIHTDRRRRRWIHVWMLLAMLITPAGVAGLAVLPGTEAFVLITIMAAVVYGIGSVCWVVSLAFRLTVMPWAAEQAERTDEPPDGFAALDEWATSLFTIHMAASYAAFAALGVAVLVSDTFPLWLGWVGVGWGVAFLSGFVATGSTGPFSPPFWAHSYPLMIGVVLLAT